MRWYWIGFEIPTVSPQTETPIHAQAIVVCEGAAAGRECFGTRNFTVSAYNFLQIAYNDGWGKRGAMVSSDARKPPVVALRQ